MTSRVSSAAPPFGKHNNQEVRLTSPPVSPCSKPYGVHQVVMRTPPLPPPPTPAHTERALCCMNNCSCAKGKSHSSLWKIYSLLAELRKEKRRKKKSEKKIHTTEPFVLSLSLSPPPPPPPPLFFLFFFFSFLSSFSFFSPFFPCFVVVFNTKRER